MSDVADVSTSSHGLTAGGLLRVARESRGLHIAALASMIKVTPRKLELLEADRYDELVDATFARALAQTVCRTLKIDAAPVLALLPRSGPGRLGKIGQNLNAPYRESSGSAASSDVPVLARPAVWGPLLLLLLAAAVYLTPRAWIVSLSTQAGLLGASSSPGSPPVAGTDLPAGEPYPRAVESSVYPAGMAASESAGPLGESSVGAAPAVAETAAASTLASASASASVSASASTLDEAKTLQVRVSAKSWIEVIDAGGRSLLSRTVEPGEVVDLAGALPFKVRIGNAAATQLFFKGQPFSIAPYTRENLVRLELK